MCMCIWASVYIGLCLCVHICILIAGSFTICTCEIGLSFSNYQTLADFEVAGTTCRCTLVRRIVRIVRIVPGNNSTNSHELYLAKLFYTHDCEMSRNCYTKIMNSVSRNILIGSFVQIISAAFDHGDFSHQVSVPQLPQLSQDWSRTQ